MSLKCLVIGIGQAGNKCVVDAIENGAVKEEDTILVNSTSMDFPKNYKGKMIVTNSHNVGCGKERSISKQFIKSAIKQGVFNFDKMAEYSTVSIVSSIEGGTGSGATPILSKYFHQVALKNVHVFALAGFEEDVRGIGNMIEFFQEIDSNIVLHTISNKAFLSETGNNKIKAEELANKEFCKRYRILIGDTLIASSQNIDDTDILKLSNTNGYTTVEFRYLDKALCDSDDYNKVVKRMIYESKSIKSTNPCASKIGVILNLSSASQEAITDPFETIKEAYGMPFECFKHIQYDGQKEYVAFIVSGMKLPIDELQATYDRYIEASSKVNKDNDNFFDSIKAMKLNEEDKKFDMIKTPVKAKSIDDFLSDN
jgi:cell division GTPase FtsZ